jgi:hypothetical protein
LETIYLEESVLWPLTSVSLSQILHNRHAISDVYFETHATKLLHVTMCTSACHALTRILYGTPLACKAFQKRVSYSLGLPQVYTGAICSTKRFWIRALDCVCMSEYLLMHCRTVRKPSRIIGCADKLWSYTDKVKDLKTDDLAALVSDGSALQYRIAQETECSLHTLQEDLGAFDHAFAFRANFSRDYPNLIPDINGKLLEWNEQGNLKVCAFHCSSLL